MNELMEKELRSFLGDRTIPDLMLEIAEKKYPDFQKMFYPRCYENLGGYHSPKVVAAYLASVLDDFKRKGLTDKTLISYKLMAPSLKYLIDRQVPYMFVAPSLLNAIKQTEIMDEIDWSKMKLPYEHGVFILPKGGLVHPTDGETSMILYSRNYQGVAPLPKGFRSITIPETSFSVVSLIPDKAIWYDTNLTIAKRPTVKPSGIYFEYSDLPSFKEKSDQDYDLEGVDKPYIQNLGALTFGLLLALTVRPDLLVLGERTKIVLGKKGREPKEFWTPNIVGKNYVARTTKEVHEAGTHASPRTHFRRGHFRNQAYGTNYSQRRLQWIEPILVNA